MRCGWATADHSTGRSNLVRGPRRRRMNPFPVHVVGYNPLAANNPLERLIDIRDDIANCSLVPERNMRLKAARRAYYEVGSRWTTSQIPFKWKRAASPCHVQNAAPSGIEAFVPTRKDFDMLDTVVASFGRLAVRGKAGEEKIPMGLR